MHISEYRNIFENEETHFYYVGYHQIILSKVKRYLKNSGKKLKILDAGCGTGLLAKKLEKFGQVYGVDISKEALKYSKMRGIKVIKSSVTKLPYPNNTFDIVLSIDVLYHKSITDDKLAIEELNRVLKKGGLLILKLPAFNWLRTSHDEVVFTKRRYTSKEVVLKLNKQGFQNISATYAGSFLLPLLLIRKISEGIYQPKNHSSVRKTPKIINQFLIVLFNIENILLRRMNIPMGITIIATAQKSA